MQISITKRCFACFIFRYFFDQFLFDVLRLARSMIFFKMYSMHIQTQLTMRVHYDDGDPINFYNVFAFLYYIVTFNRNFEMFKKKLNGKK